MPESANHSLARDIPETLTENQRIAHTAANVLGRFTERYPLLKYVHKFPWLRDLVLSIAESAALEEAGFDQKFGVLNLKGLEERAIIAADELRRVPEGILKNPIWALIYVEGNKFGEVNKFPLSERVGDEFLAGYAAIFCSSVRRTDLVARHGGDEWMILIRLMPQLDKTGDQHLRQIVESGRHGSNDSWQSSILQAIAEKTLKLKSDLEIKYPPLKLKSPDAGTLSLGVIYFTGHDVLRLLDNHLAEGRNNAMPHGFVGKHLRSRAEKLAQIGKTKGGMVAVVSDSSSDAQCHYRVINFPQTPPPDAPPQTASS